MNYKLLSTAFFVGIIGDAILQLSVKLRPNLNIGGLRDYFKQHGIFESLLIAGGTMLIATWFFLKLKIPLTYFNLFVFGGVLDILWRQLNLMPSLKNTYYEALNPVESFIWGGIPMMMVLGAWKLLE